MQEYCYENMNFMRAFSKLVVMLYKTNVLSEEVILKWYRETNSSKGKMMFLDQMKKFVEWLQSAEEGNKHYIYYHPCIYTHTHTRRKCWN